ncbi:MAG: aminoacyl-tRNA hydrolase [Thermodesulfobacteriota bacterium]|nr:aminoacyl-tRNA hydrolase [Thermodesulfobacteriota bacterium]
MKVIYGLGNPGGEYLFTRHNIGFMVVDMLSIRWGIPIKKKTRDVLYGRGTRQGIEVMLAKPYTYMNLSGRPLKGIAIDSHDLIVAHDDMDIPFGMIRIKTQDGTGGHKGLKSIIDNLGTDAFVRVRCGIGRPDEESDPIDYVLSEFRSDEEDTLKEEIELAGDAIHLCVISGSKEAMNVYNRRDLDNSKT